MHWFTPDLLEIAMLGTFIPAAFSKGSVHASLTNASAAILVSSVDLYNLSKRETRRSYLVKTAIIGAAIR